MSLALRAFWPIRDLSEDLIAQAEAELPMIAAQAHARIIGPRKWHILPGKDVPGAAAYPWVLLVLAPAERVDHIETARRALAETPPS